MTDTPLTPPPKPGIHLNWQDWLPYLEDCTIPDDDKRQTIESVWNIMVGFVDRGWRLDAGEITSGQSFDLTAALCAAVSNSEEQNNAPSSSEAVGQENMPTSHKAPVVKNNKKEVV